MTAAPHPPVTFSVQIPLRDGGATIEAALRSLVAQTEPDWRCLVVDGGSTDDSLVRARRVEDPRITVDATGGAATMTGNWNRALAAAHGTYTLLLGQDDLLHPEALAVLRATFAAHPDVAMVAFGALVRVPDGPDRHLARRLAGRIDPDELRRQALVAGDTPAPSQVAYRTAALRPLLPLDERYRYCPEIDLQYRVGLAGAPALFLTECLGERGNDPSRLSGRLRDTPLPRRDHYRLVDTYGHHHPALAARRRRQLHGQALRAALRALKHRRPRRAAAHLRSAVQHLRPPSRAPYGS